MRAALLALSLILPATVLAQPATTLTGSADVDAAIERGDAHGFRRAMRETLPASELILGAIEARSPQTILDAVAPGPERDRAIASYVVQTLDFPALDTIGDPLARDLTTIYIVPVGYARQGDAPPEDFCRQALRGGYTASMAKVYDLCQTTVTAVRDVATDHRECVDKLPSRLSTANARADAAIAHSRADAVASCRALVMATLHLEKKLADAKREDIERIAAGGDALTCDLTGAWDTNHGEVRFTHTNGILSAEYDHDGGRLTGVLTGRAFLGQWHEAPTRAAPRDAGDTHIEFSEDCQSLEGVWRKGPGPRWTGTWTGTKRA